MRRGSSGGGWVIAAVLMLRAVAIVSPIVGAFVLVTALVGGVIEDERLRLAAGVLVCGALPLVLFGRLHALLQKRGRRIAIGWAPFVAIVDAMLVTVLALGFADDCGRALRRHGDWFVGERHGAVARGYRDGVTVLAAWLERFDPPPDLAPIVIPPDPHLVPYGPYRPGEKPPEVEPTIVAWYHPLAGPRRALPYSESRRFGAQRPPPRPRECELGHCGVDLGSTLGEPVFAVFEGVVERIERDDEKGGRAGRYVRIGHKDGTVVSRYIHLDTIRDDLKEGDRVTGGELIGRVGKSGVHESGPHLHFGLSQRPSGRGGDEIYIDPEPYLRTWKLPDASSLTRVALAGRL